VGGRAAGGQANFADDVPEINLTLSFFPSTVLTIDGPNSGKSLNNVGCSSRSLIYMNQCTEE